MSCYKLFVEFSVVERASEATTAIVIQNEKLSPKAQGTDKLKDDGECQTSSRQTVKAMQIDARCGRGRDIFTALGLRGGRIRMILRFRVGGLERCEGAMGIGNTMRGDEKEKDLR